MKTTFTSDLFRAFSVSSIEITNFFYFDYNVKTSRKQQIKTQHGTTLHGRKQNMHEGVLRGEETN